MRWRLLSAVFLVMTLVAAACGDDDAATTTTGAAESCEIADLTLVTPGVLTVATGEPAFPPWVGTPDGENFDTPE